MGDDARVLHKMLAAGLIVAAAGGAAAGLLYARVRARRRRLPPPARAPRPLWNGVAVLAAVGLFVLFNLAVGLVQAGLISAGFFQRLYGPDFPLDSPPNPDTAHKAAANIRYLWSSAVAFPFQVLAIALLPRALRVANPYHARGWRLAVVVGYLTWLIVTPAAFCVFVLASIGHQALTGQGPEKHPLTALGNGAGGLEWSLFVLQTVVIAPVLEEWLFRGILLPWLAQKRPVPPLGQFTVPPDRRPTLVLLAAFAVGTAFTLGEAWRLEPDRVRQAFATDPAATIAYLAPAAFFLALVPFDLLLPRLGWVRRRLRVRSEQQVRAVWASSALFAAAHAHVWPSPVPLVVLAVGLGYLYLRTRSLVGPVVVHGLFNAVSATYLLLGGPA